MRQALLFTIILTLSSYGGLRTGEAAGPWRAQVVDAETGEPLKGMIVVAYWSKMTRGPGGASASFYDAEEVVTGPDGHFTIATRWTFTLNPFTHVEGPEVKIFKPGYGRWRIKDWEKKPKAWEELTAGEVLEKEGIVIELPPLKTREERLEFLSTPSRSPSARVPPERTKRFDEAVREERAYLGLRN